MSFNKERVKFVEKLEHFDKAPYEFHKENTDYDMALLKFFNKRSMPPQRYNFDEIMKATGCKDGFELSFKAHGISSTKIISR